MKASEYLSPLLEAFEKLKDKLTNPDLQFLFFAEYVAPEDSSKNKDPIFVENYLIGDKKYTGKHTYCF